MFFSAVLGAGVVVVCYIRVVAFLHTAYRQTFQIRVALLRAVLHQEIGWFDTHDAGELGSRLAELVLTVLHTCYGYLYVLCNIHSVPQKLHLLTLCSK